jgi:hypothetical protein
MMDRRSLYLRLATTTLVFALAACHGSPQSLALPNVGATRSQGAAVPPALQELLSRRHGPLGPQVQTSGWLSPRAAAGKDLVYVGILNSGSGAVNIYSTQGQAQQPIGVITNGVNSPEGLAVDHAGNLYVTNPPSNTVTVYPPGQTSPSAMYSNGVSTPYGVAVGADGTVYIANQTGGPGGVGSVTEYPKGSMNPSQTITQAGLFAFADALDRAGNLYVSWFDASTFAISVYKYAPNSTTGTNLNLPAGIFPAFSLAFDDAGNLVLAVENGNNALPPKFIAVFPPGATNPSRTIEGGSLLDIVQGIAFPRKSSRFYYVASSNFHDWMRLTYPETLPRDVNNQNSPATGLVLSPGT